MIVKHEFLGVFDHGGVEIELGDASVPILGIIHYEGRLIIIVADGLSEGQITTMNSVIAAHDTDGLAARKIKRIELVRIKTGTVIDEGGDDTGEQALTDAILAATNQAQLDAVVDTRT